MVFLRFLCAWKGVFHGPFVGIVVDLPPLRPVISPGAAGTQRWLNGCCELVGLVLFKGEGGGTDPSGCGDGTLFPPQNEVFFFLSHFIWTCWWAGSAKMLRCGQVKDETMGAKETPKQGPSPGCFFQYESWTSCWMPFWHPQTLQNMAVWWRDSECSWSRNTVFSPEGHLKKRHPPWYCLQNHAKTQSIK